MVAAAPRRQTGPPGVADRALVLDRHLRRDLYGHRARVGEEDLVQRAGGEAGEPRGQLDCRFVREPAEHHVAHRVDLPVRGRVEVWVPVTVDRRPPRAHAVDELAPVGQPQPHTLRRDHRQWLGARGEPAVGVPHVLGVGGEKGGGARLRGVGGEEGGGSVDDDEVVRAGEVDGGRHVRRSRARSCRLRACGWPPSPPASRGPRRAGPSAGPRDRRRRSSAGPGRRAGPRW